MASDMQVCSALVYTQVTRERNTREKAQNCCGKVWESTQNRCVKLGLDFFSSGAQLPINYTDALRSRSSAFCATTCATREVAAVLLEAPPREARSPWGEKPIKPLRSLGLLRVRCNVFLPWPVCMMNLCVESAQPSWGIVTMMTKTT